MRTWITKSLALFLVVALAVPVMAQGQGRGRGTQGRGRGGQGTGGFGRGGFGGGFTRGGSLLTNTSVQEELKLTGEQKEKLEKLNSDYQTTSREKMREAFSGGQVDREKMTKIMTEMREELAKSTKEVLKPEQAKRLRQIEVQQLGFRAFAEKDVQAALKLSDKQAKEATEILEEIRSDAQQLMQDAGRDREKLREIQAKVDALTKDEFEKYTDSLSADQKAAWKNVLGEKFEVVQQPFGRGGQPGGRGGQPGGFGRGITVGQVIPSFLADRLELTEKQKAEVAALEKEAKEKINSILTDEQKKALEEMSQGRGRGGEGRGRGGEGRGRGGDSGRPARPTTPPSN